MPSHSQKPNILWICTDQQRADSLGCYGNPHVDTPNIDRLAREGMLFEKAFCQNPICTPSRASFLTGRYPCNTGARQNGQSINPTEVPVPRTLADAGYVCGLGGKLHISSANFGANHAEPRIDDGYSVFHWSHHPYRRWGMPTNQYQLWLRDQGVEFEMTDVDDSGRVQTSMPRELHYTHWCTRKAMSFMEECQHFEQPWLFSLNIFDPHHPFDPPKEFLDKYMDRLDDLPLPSYTEGEEFTKTIFQEMDARGNPESDGVKGPKYTRKQMNDRDHRLCKAAYWAMCENIDWNVGLLLDYLEKSGQRENTLVIFMSDHGEMLGDHGIYYKGAHLVDCLTNVPFIISQPGRIPQGVRRKALVELTDLVPTLLEYCGLPASKAMQGRSMLPLWQEGTPDTHREDVYCEFHNSQKCYLPEKAYVTMLRTQEHKLIAAHGQERGELYDLARDPQEAENRWDDPAYAGIKLELYQKLCDRMAWTADPLPVRDGAW